MQLESARAQRAAFAAVTAVTVLTWYALPDVVRSRPARAAIKTGLLGVTVAGAAVAPKVYPAACGVGLGAEPATATAGDARRTTAAQRAGSPAAERILPRPVATGIAATLALGATAGLAAVTVWFERAIFTRGERRRAAGHRCAHTPAAVALALVSAAPELLDWDRLVTDPRQG